MGLYVVYCLPDISFLICIVNEMINNTNKIMIYNKSDILFALILLNEPRREKTCLPGFRPGQTQMGLYRDRRWIETGNFKFRK